MHSPLQCRRSLYLRLRVASPAIVARYYRSAAAHRYCLHSSSMLKKKEKKAGQPAFCMRGGLARFATPKIRFPDSTIRKSTIYVNFASRTPLHPKKNMIHFWIVESVAHSQIPNSNNRRRSVLEFTKLWVCRKKNVEVQEETAFCNMFLQAH